MNDLLTVNMINFWNHAKKARFWANFVPFLMRFSKKNFKCDFLQCFSETFNSFMSVKLNLVLWGTIFSVTVVFDQRPNSKFWHAKKIDFEKSFKMSTNLTYFAFLNAEIFSFKVRVFYFLKKSNFAISVDTKELTRQKLTFWPKFRLQNGRQ